MSPEPQPAEINSEGHANAGELADALAEVKRLRAEIEGRVVELDRALERLRALGGSEYVPDQGRLAREEEAGESVPEEATLRVTEMALSGRGRAEIVAVVRDRYGLADAGSFVDEILGRHA